jgi:hypothetical protein
LDDHESTVTVLAKQMGFEDESELQDWGAWALASKPTAALAKEELPITFSGEMHPGLQQRDARLS